ncbi:MAG: addiction module toxin, HicA family [Candidatus Aminicenantes bacterium]|nr:addiction module toxin, HicA family [Candidatus Aminicenantes bacterium]
MKREKLIRELSRQGCVLIRHGKKHDIYLNSENGRKAPIPRHIEIKNSLCILIRKQLAIK